MLGFVIAGVSSGSGKTTVTNGLLRAFVNHGLKAAPFKVGPDYIDTQFHRVASGVPSINLDLFMSDEDKVKEVFCRYSREMDVCVVEGVMGLFDGYDKDKGSASEIARILNLPVILVVNAASSAYSLVALLTGFKNFDKRIRIAGVIFNNVASENHLRLLKSASEDSGIPFLGYVRRDASISIPSRHLGLSLYYPEVMEDFIRKAEKIVTEGVNVEALLKADELRLLSPRHRVDFTNKERGEKRRGRIAVAWDEAFNFVYPENLRGLAGNHKFGGEIIMFSPLEDKRMPNADFLYIPGGYPELFAARLAANLTMRASIRDFIENGGYALAECGGLIYVCEKLDEFEMCGVLPIKVTMDNARLHLGYRTIKAGNFTIRGHEFHYSSVIENKERIGGLKSCAEQFNVKGDRVSTPVYRYKNLIAGYTHLYWGDNDISEIYENIHA